jgi:hypothetical protein
MKKYRLPVAIGLTLVLLLGCAMPKTKQFMISQDKVWNQKAFEVMEQKWNKIQKEAGTCSLTLKNVQTLQTLFYKSIDSRNSKIDYQKSSEYAVLLLQVSGENSALFHNWVMVLDRLSSMKNRIDSLEQSITALKSDVAGAKKERLELEKERVKLEENLYWSQQEGRVLKDSMAAQAEVIEKLKKLELFLRDNRKRF